MLEQFEYRGKMMNEFKMERKNPEGLYSSKVLPRQSRSAAMPVQATSGDKTL